VSRPNARREDAVGAIRNLGIAAIMGLLVSATPFVVGAWFAFHPTDRLLALMRPLSLAAVFAALGNTFLGLANVLVYFSRHPTPPTPNHLAAQLAETTVVPFVSFACLSAAWLFVAFGMRRQL
jgi:hypothetical protein